MTSQPGPEYPRNAEEAELFLNNLVFADTTEDEHQKPSPNSTAPQPTKTDESEPDTTNTSIRLPNHTLDRLREVAAEHNTTVSGLIRDYINIGLTSEQPDTFVWLSDAIRVISALAVRGELRNT
ncbi:hypothetical protein [Nocardia sp. NPDC059228]|uniref:hypothetical protein n=1 Tax=Nocardia sp. NPDC059228 TaxID=3346777 RepID=UPI00369AF316